MGLKKRHRIFTFLIIFVEVRWLLRICPTSPRFDAFIAIIDGNGKRSAFYAVMCIVLWLSIIIYATSLIVPAVFLLFPTGFYLAGWFSNQSFVGSEMLGLRGVSQMIV